MSMGGSIPARYRTLLESIDEGFCVIEKIDAAGGEPSDYRFVEANPAFAVHSGIDNVLGRTLREVVPTEGDGWIQIYDSVLSTGTPRRFEHELVTMGRELELYAFRVDDAARRRVGVVFKDITGRKLADGLLCDSEERYRRLFESAKDGILIPPIARVAKVEQGCRVLIVDDSVDTTHSLALLLSASGHIVRTAHDGPGALAALARESADVVLMDIGLPGMDGYEVARRIRRQPGSGSDRVVLVAMTGYGQERDRQLARDAGFDHHLVKPADFAELLGILARVASDLVSAN